MRCKSAADIKHKYGRVKDHFPREGTKIREVYDLFQAHKGIMLHISLSEMGIEGSGIVPLVDFYGLDIRNFGHGKWCLVGEWFDKDYVDYLAPKIKPAKVRKK